LCTISSLNMDLTEDDYDALYIVGTDATDYARPRALHIKQPERFLCVATAASYLEVQALIASGGTRPISAASHASEPVVSPAIGAVRV
jgi:hypothetical protein